LGDFVAIALTSWAVVVGSVTACGARIAITASTFGSARRISSAAA